MWQCGLGNGTRQGGVHYGFVASVPEMDDSLPPSRALSLLAELFRGRRSGLLSLGPQDARLHVRLLDGQVVGLGPLAAAPPPPPEPDESGPNDSARLRLDRVLADVGLRRPRPGKAKPAARAADPAPLRERVVAALADSACPAFFEENAAAPPDVAEAVGATEPLILEAVRRVRDGEAVRAALGDLDRRLVATTALAEERTLTLTEGYLLSRIDGLSTAREVLQLVPLDPEETERSLLGLLLTGRVEGREAPRPQPVPRAEPEAASPAAAGAPGEAGPGERVELVEEDEPGPAFPPPTGGPLDPATSERRREILEVFQSLPLKNHFEVLGVEPGCTDAEVKAAYVALVKRFHPDAGREAGTADLHDVLEAIFIRVGEAWEVLGDGKSRLSYEARSGVVRKPREGGAAPAAPPPSPAPAPPGPPPPPDAIAYVSPEETLLKAQILLSRARYWDAIQVLEAAVPHMEPRRHQNRGRILLAKAYAKNPLWVRRAEETLQDVVREDPANVDAHYELGLLYKAGGLATRAQAMFRRVLELRPDHREAVAELGPDGTGGGGLLKRIFGKGKAS
jgi:hypothetical protein